MPLRGSIDPIAHICNPNWHSVRTKYVNLQHTINRCISLFFWIASLCSFLQERSLWGGEVHDDHLDGNAGLSTKLIHRASWPSGDS